VKFTTAGTASVLLNMDSIMYELELMSEPMKDGSIMVLL
jgi:hypothetical protein